MDGDYGGGGHGSHEFTSRRGRPNRRNATDIGTTYVDWMHKRRSNRRGADLFEAERPTPSYVADMLPPAARRGKAVDSIPAKHLHSSLNKVRHPVNVVRWTPEGRRLLTGSTSGEFTLWNGTAFNFDTIMQAHDCAVRAITYAHNDEWLVSADQDGVVKYWQTNFNNVKEIQAHTDPIRDIAFAPTDSKFVTASDDAQLKIFDFAGGVEENVLTGHQWDAKSVDWHPTKGLLVSGSKDHQVKLWDPRTGRCLTTLHGHKNTVNMTKFEPINGVLLASCARDQTARIFDIRMMRDVFLLKGHEKEIISLVWHPIHSSLITTGGGDGSMFHYLLDEPNTPAGVSASISPYDSPNPADAPAQTLYPAHKVQNAHDFNIWSMAWHPLGHILASGSNDKATRFWTRPRPGDSSYVNDRWHIGQQAAEQLGTWKKTEAQRQRDEEDDDEADALEDQTMPIKQSLPGLPGLPGMMGAGPSITTQPDGTSTGGAQPVNLPNLPFPIPGQGFPPTSLPPQSNGIDMNQLSQMMQAGQLPPLPPHTNGGPQNGASPFPSMPMPMPMPPGLQPPPGMPGLPGMGGTPAQMSAAEAAMAAAVRKRGPLPSQQESLQAEMRQGRYTKPR